MLAGNVADIYGQYARFTIRKELGVCDMTGAEVKAVVDEWDNVIRKNNELVHTASASVPQEWATAGLKMKKGVAMHSGYMRSIFVTSLV